MQMNAIENSIEFASRRLKDPSGNLSIGGAILENYKKVSKVPIKPYLSWIKPKDVMLFGLRGWDRLSSAGREKSHVVLRAGDLLRLDQFPSSFNYDLKAYGQLYQAILTKDYVSESNIVIFIKSAMWLPGLILYAEFTKPGITSVLGFWLAFFYPAYKEHLKY